MCNIFLLTAAHLTDFHRRQKLQLKHSSSKLAVNMCMCLGEDSAFIFYVNNKMDPNNFCIEWQTI